MEQDNKTLETSKEYVPFNNFIAYGQFIKITDNQEIVFRVEHEKTLEKLEKIAKVAPEKVEGELKRYSKPVWQYPISKSDVSDLEDEEIEPKTYMKVGLLPWNKNNRFLSKFMDIERGTNMKLVIKPAKWDTEKSKGYNLTMVEYSISN